MLVRSADINVYRAADILESLSDAFTYGRTAYSNHFKLEEAAKQSLDDFDTSFRCLLVERIKSEDVELAEHELAKCKLSVGQAIFCVYCR